jgi:inner membrane protein
LDLLTQVVLGATAGEVVSGKKAGNKANVLGAFGGLIPDLDVLLAQIAGGLCYLIHKKKTIITKFEWMNLIFWSAFTHPILDYLTTYGTGAFLPFNNYRVESGAIGIADLKTATHLVHPDKVLFTGFRGIR